MTSRLSNLGAEVERLVERIIAATGRLGEKFKADAERLFFRIDGFCCNRLASCEAPDAVIRILGEVGDFFDKPEQVKEAHSRFISTMQISDALARMRTRYNLDARNARLIWDVIYELLGAPLVHGHMVKR